MQRAAHLEEEEEDLSPLISHVIKAQAKTRTV